MNPPPRFRLPAAVLLLALAGGVGATIVSGTPATDAQATDVPGRTEIWNVPEDSENLETLLASLPCQSGVRILFVNRILANHGSPRALTVTPGSGMTYGIVCPAGCSSQTVGHELGHACGLEDLYISNPQTPDNPFPVFSQTVSSADTLLRIIKERLDPVDVEAYERLQRMIVH